MPSGCAVQREISIMWIPCDWNASPTAAEPAADYNTNTYEVGRYATMRADNSNSREDYERGCLMSQRSIIQMPEWENLRRATDALYEAFAVYPLRKEISRCDHCVGPEDDARLRSKLLRDLSYDDLALFVGNPGTWGDQVDCKHFLPRLFELASLASLGLGDWSRHLNIANVSYRVTTRISAEDVEVAAWPQDERLVLRDFSMAWWRALLSIVPSDNSIEAYFQGTAESKAYAVICAIAQFIEDMSPYLQIWREAMEGGRSLLAANHLLVFVAEYRDAVLWSGSETVGGWWGKRSQQWQQVSNWARDPLTARAFYHALETLETPNFVGTRDPATYALILSEEMPDFLLPTLSWLANRAASACADVV